MARTTPECALERVTNKRRRCCAVLLLFSVRLLPVPGAHAGVPNSKCITQEFDNADMSLLRGNQAGLPPLDFDLPNSARGTKTGGGGCCVTPRQPQTLVCVLCSSTCLFCGGPAAVEAWPCQWSFSGFCR